MPFPFAALLISAAFTVAGQLLAPRVTDKAAGLSELDFPTATESRPIPYFFGTVEHKSPNTLWFGDYSTAAIKSSLIAGLLLGAVGVLLRQVVGHKYYVGFDLGLGIGEFDALRKIIIGEKVAWEGNQKTGTITINKPELFGKKDREGGFQATVEIYPGSNSQTASAYMRSKCNANYPPYKNISHLVFRGLTSGKGAYIGNQPRLDAIKFELQRFPNSLGVTGGKHIINGADANPVCVLYDILIDSEVGAGYTAADFNLTNWRLAAEQCYADGYGVSGLLDSAIDVDKLVDEFLNVIDGVINQNLETAEFELDTVRGDYDPNLIPTLSPDDVISYEFERASWLDNVSAMRLSYIDRENGFKQRDVTTTNTAMNIIQNESRTQDVDIKFISTAALANKICFREMVVATVPFARVKLTVNRKGYNFRQGTVFRLINSPFGASSVIFRVTKQPDFAALKDGRITIEAVEDVFGLSLAVFNSPAQTGWTPPSTLPAGIAAARIIEQPRFLHSSDKTRVFALAIEPDGATETYNAYLKQTSDSIYTLESKETAFTPSGTLLGKYKSKAFDTGVSLVIVPDAQTSDIAMSIAPLDIANGSAGLILIDDEILAYESASINADGNFVLTNVWGGLLDTTLTKHAAGSRVWFFAEGASFVLRDYTDNTAISAKFQSIAGATVTDLTSASIFTLATVRRSLKPYPPAVGSVVDTSAIN